MSMQNLTIEIGFDRFPPEHTCDGENVSPAIRVRGSDTPYLAVIVDDPDAPRGTFTHWLAWNIPATGEIPGGIPPEPRVSHPVPAVQGTNDFRRIGYGGPCPPKGASHRFFIRVWGLEQELDLAPGAGRSRLEDTLAPAATGYGETMAIYERRKVLGTRPPAGHRT
jgi:Raf kinase inhibitor-like YbhB/YbcL family protein